MESVLFERASDMVEEVDRPLGRILLAEDDQLLAQFLTRILMAESYQVQCVSSGRSVLEHLDASFSVLLLDLNLPDLDGLGVLQQMRPQFPRLSVLVLTARGRADGLLPALDGGADDCLLKPFSYLELLARLRALLRRNTPTAAPQGSCADLVLHKERNAVTRGDRRIDLTPREFALLEFLLRTPDVPVSRAALLQAVWGETCEPSTNVVDVYMKYIRDKIDLPGLPKLVRTVRGTGYMVSAS